MTPQQTLIANIAFILLYLAVAIPMIRGFSSGAPFLPSPWRAARKMASLAKITATTRVIDPGCGDGRLLVACLEAGAAYAEGYELFFFAYLAAKLRSLKWKGRMRIFFRDSRKRDLGDFDLYVAYMLPKTFEKLKPHLRTLPLGAHIVSYAFDVPGWIPQTVAPGDPAANIAPIKIYERGAEGDIPPAGLS